MALLSLIPSILRELLGPRRLDRQPEPEQTMEEASQVAAYLESGGVMEAAYLFHTARMCTALAGSRTVLDLGCGPATQLLQVAALNPATDFIGVDLSSAMLAMAEAQTKKLGLRNVRFVQADITELTGFGNHSVDGVISTMTLHHLPTQAHLAACFRAIARVLRPRGAVYLTDFVRPKAASTVQALVSFDAETTHPLFARDYEYSLRAAFLASEFAGHASALGQATLFGMVPVDVLMVLKSEDRPLPRELQVVFASRRAALTPKFRRTLDDLRLCFRLGGMQGDPFRHSPPSKAVVQTAHTPELPG